MSPIAPPPSPAQPPAQPPAQQLAQQPASPPVPSPRAAGDGVLWADIGREQQFHAWLASVQERFALQPESLRLASADASFRRYLRIDTQGGMHGESLIIMDAPPDKENSEPFVQVAELLLGAAIRAPEVLDWQQAHGFLLLTDLGARTMMQVIDPAAAPPLGLYLQAVDTLIRWQKASREGVLPTYDQALLRRELDLFPQWYIAQHRQVRLSEDQRKVLEAAFETIIAENLTWPSVYVHRDFMPRNLMVPTSAATPHPQAAHASLGRPGAGEMGVLDFQDAVYGPITYDIASLVRDAFLSWDEDFCLDVVVRYWQKARQAGLPVGDDFGVFYRAVEWMGLQRHLKIAGIFARLSLRDGKAHYLADTPRFIGYIRATCARYRELKPLLRLIDNIEGIEEPNVFGLGRSPGAC